ncbi:MAG TPA: hypothetical protein VFT08_08150 [Pyrinomonadaceae bacterium]|nr:hypothetical protein [Pyrinomonadaceae bacterium]
MEKELYKSSFSTRLPLTLAVGQRKPDLQTTIGLAAAPAWQTLNTDAIIRSLSAAAD